MKDSKILSNGFINFTYDAIKEREMYHVDSNKVIIRNLCMLLSAINKPMCNKISSACIFYL